MGLSGSSMIPTSSTTDSPPPECPVHKETSFSPATATAGDCPASFGASQLTMSDADVDPANMVII